MNKHIPIRMCIACKKRFRKQDLSRFVRNKNNQLIKTQEFPGRGFYVCEVKECLEKAKKRYSELKNTVF